MTNPPAVAPTPPRPPAPRTGTAVVVPTDAIASALDPKRAGAVLVTWALVLLVGLVLVVYGIGPYLHMRHQRVLLEEYRGALYRASQESSGLYGMEAPTKAPTIGEPVAILEIGAVQMQQVVVEGAGPSQTQVGPGHVPGTAIPGQPYNSVIVGRAGTFGGPFGALVHVKQGDPVLVTTTQGQRVYVIESVRRVELVEPGEEADPPPAVPTAAGTSVPGTAVPAAVPTTAGTSVPGTSSPPAGETASTTAGSTAPGTAPAAPDAVPASVPGLIAPAPPLGSRPTEKVRIDDLYALGQEHKLTLVTSDSGWPWNRRDAVVVTAKMRQKPFVDWTPPNGRTDVDDGRSGEGGAVAALVLSILGLAVAAGVSVALYRTRRGYVAYLLSSPPLLAFVVLAAEMLNRLLPAWS